MSWRRMTRAAVRTKAGLRRWRRPMIAIEACRTPSTWGHGGGGDPPVAPAGEGDPFPKSVARWPSVHPWTRRGRPGSSAWVGSCGWAVKAGMGARLVVEGGEEELEAVRGGQEGVEALLQRPEHRQPHGACTAAPAGGGARAQKGSHPKGLYHLTLSFTLSDPRGEKALKHAGSYQPRAASKLNFRAHQFRGNPVASGRTLPSTDIREPIRAGAEGGRGRPRPRRRRGGCTGAAA